MRKPQTKWNQDNANVNRLAAAKRAAPKVKAESWWAVPNLSRDEFQARLKTRHAEILNSASNSTRSINRAI